MKVYVLMVCIRTLLGGCSWEVQEYIESIYLDKARAKSIGKKLQKENGVSRYDYEVYYYVKEWEVK